MSVLNNINFLRKISVYPCENPGPVIFIETAFEAGAPVLLELASWSCIDILKLRAGISYRCGKQLKAIIKAAHGAEVIDRTHFVYKFAAPVERALWYWFVADLATSFLAHWTSLIYQANHCGPIDRNCVFVGEHNSFHLFQPGIDMGIQYHYTTAQCDQSLLAPYGFFVPPGYYWSAVFTLHIAKWVLPYAGDLALWLERVEPSHTVFHENNWQARPPDGGVGGSYKLTGHNERATTYERYQFTGRSSKWAQTAGGSCSIKISPFPILDDPQLGVGCFNRDWRLVPW